MKPVSPSTVLPRWLQSWERFWFTPMDPTPLALIRIMAGLIILYTFVVYCFCLPEMMGPHAWVDEELREQFLHDRPVITPPLLGSRPYDRPQTPLQEEALARYHKLFGTLEPRHFGLPLPQTQAQWDYLEAYTRKWGQPPPAYAVSKGEVEEVDAYIKQFSRPGFIVDARVGGLKMPQSKWEKNYLYAYTERWHAPPPAYPKDEAEAAEIDAYMQQEGYDPRLVYARGMPGWSVWMHVYDPRWMAWVQGAFVLFALLFTLGLATRVTAPLTWIAMLCYLHRNAQVAFGADTMINILLFYLSVGPSGAALSLDRLIARRWRGTAADVPPTPRVSANVAIRLLQIHVCIIYLMAGVGKMQGTAWWNGTALWSVFANYEFAPMNVGLYTDLLRFIARDELLLQAFLTFGAYFTLVFEVGYAFLIWPRQTRWIYLGMALLLHGTIGVFMGLKTFSFVMLVMNMAFLRPEEVHWLLGKFRRPASAPAAALVEPVMAAR